VERRPGHVDSLARGQRAPRDHPAFQAALTGAYDDQRQASVVQQHGLTGPQVAQQLRVGHGDLARTTRLRARRQCNLVALVQLDRPTLDLAHAQLWSLQVGHHGHQLPLLLRDLAQRGNGLGMRGMVAMGKVDARQVHPGPDETAHHVRRTRGRPDRADKLGTRHRPPP
jgi:hypothetical protein